MDGEFYLNVIKRAKVLRHFFQNMLRLSDGHAVAGNDDDLGGVFHNKGGVLGVAGLGYFIVSFVGRRFGGFGAEAAEHDAAQRTVHGFGHDVGKNCAAGADNGADDNQQNIVEREADADGRPAGVSIQNRDNDRHVGAADGQNEEKAEQNGQAGQNIEKFVFAAENKEHAERDDRQAENKVQQLLSGEDDCFGRHQSLKFGKGNNRTGKCYGADDVREGVAIMWHEGVEVSITGNSTNPTRFQHPVAGTYKKERVLAGKPYFSVASGGGTGRTLHPDNMAAGPASYGMTDTMGRMHGDAQFAGSSSVPAHVEMMGFLGMGNNPMVGATVAVAVAIEEAMKK